jgi:hypothetical protein
MPTRITAYHADMRFSAVRIANAVAWAVLIGLIAVAFVLVEVWGPFVAPAGHERPGNARAREIWPRECGQRSGAPRNPD